MTTTGPAPPTSSASNLASSCPRDLRHLERSLPQYSDAELETLRREILSTDTVAAMQWTTAQGHTPRRAADLALQQSEQHERGFPQVEACIRSSTQKPDAVISSIKAGTYDLSRPSGGISGSCIKSYIAYYYGWVANREMAVVLSCMAR